MTTILVLALGLLGAATGQNASDREILSPPPATRDVGSEQIALDVRDIHTIATPQVTTERRGALSNNQLVDERSTDAPEPPSYPKDGRGIPTLRVVGRDRCDPFIRRSGIPACDRPIESRSADYAHPSTPRLSPEQQLLANSRARLMSVISAGKSSVPLDADQADPRSAEGQTVAEIVRRDDHDATLLTNSAAPSVLPPGIAPEALINIDNASVQATPRS